VNPHEIGGRRARQAARAHALGITRTVRHLRPESRRGPSENGTSDRASAPTGPSDNCRQERSDPRTSSGVLGQVDGVEEPLVTRPPTVTVLESLAGNISCHAWAASCGLILHRSRAIARRYWAPMTAASRDVASVAEPLCDGCEGRSVVLIQVTSPSTDARCCRGRRDAPATLTQVFGDADRDILHDASGDSSSTPN
jgi:hypothetical protein